MGYEFHTKNISTDLNDLKDMANKFLSELGPGTPPDITEIKKLADYIGVPDNITECLCRGAVEVASDRALTALYSGLTDIGRLHDADNRAGGIMEALAIFGALPEAIRRHRELGVPDRITRDTFSDIIIALENYSYENDGATGIRYYKIWLHHHFTIELFKVGRLQFLLKPYRGYARLFADDTTGECVLSAEAGLAFKGDGLLDGQNGIFSPETRWESEYRDENGAYESNCLFVNGRAIRTPVSLDKNIWRLALEKGTVGIEMHIPRQRGLTRENCVESLRSVWRFFRKLYPGQRFETYFCGSWLLDARVQDFMPPGSGIVEFQKLFRLYPLSGNEWSFLDRGFGVRDPEETMKDLIGFARAADRSTSLRRGVADYILAGGRLNSNAGVIHQYDLLKMKG